MDVHQMRYAIANNVIPFTVYKVLGVKSLIMRTSVPPKLSGVHSLVTCYYHVMR